MDEREEMGDAIISGEADANLESAAARRFRGAEPVREATLKTGVSCAAASGGLRASP